MGCCSGRQAPSASDMEPKPHGADGANGLVNANAAAGANGASNGTAGSTGSSTGAAGTGDGSTAAGAADAKDGSSSGSGDGPKPARKSRSSSILKREHEKVWSEYFTDAISVTDVAAELTGTKAAAPAAAAPAAAAAPGADDAAARAARLVAARKSMVDIVGREQVTMKSTLNARLGAIFDSYDKNHSGDMDEPELRHVLEDYLLESKSQMAKLSESLFAADGELRKVLATTGKPEAEQAAELAAMKQQFGAKMQEKLSRLEAVRGASSEFAKQLLADLDRNQDGHVSRGEFMSAFQDKVEAIVDA